MAIDLAAEKIAGGGRSDRFSTPTGTASADSAPAPVDRMHHLATVSE
ncbi:hypothetical protein [Streptomyces sp. RTd22]|nr:hypothetical protein [Streptomyces sp. RTd22]